ncbi:extracellular solute-binding protein [Glycomyces sp. TRM65418]|uniref:ABC transporter substrate-binding protein n=1 Tax=Glycomyces sp. TRM65418 TaxID=2867006 RepID=UPI001CE50984|nr:extracellular solute-binding protein [Glycomyces sp. TRM65418]MCC3764706.1 extracellular solute-binding protein [Glycomyces sp. TRM65418]QZD54365.1 extracellular solute-binding protein [Glycomyces sp. TRM65418]
MRTMTTCMAASMLLLAVSACSPEESEEGDGSIVFWTPYTTPERIAIQQPVIDAFTEATGIEVEMVPLEPQQAGQTLVTSAASGDVPDVIAHSPSSTAAWAAQGLLDDEAPQEIVDSLGEDTFSRAALDMVTIDGALHAVPSDGWGHTIAYRTDLFEDAGLEPPRSVADLVAAAETLQADGMAGIAIGTTPGDVYTQEGIESMLLPFGCRLAVDGEVAIDSPECVDGLAHYQRLADAAGSAQMNVDAARAAYLSGSAAMLLFSSHIVDEIAGLDVDNPVSCPECADDPRYLAENTAFLTTFTGNGTEEPVEYGQTTNYGIPTGANVEDAKSFIEFMLSEGYVDNLASATEGRIPVRPGPEAGSTEYLDAWSELRFGNDDSQDLSIAEVYGPELVDRLAAGAEEFTRWGWGTDDAELAGIVFSQTILATEAEALFDGAPPAEVAASMAEAVEAAQQDLG